MKEAYTPSNGDEFICPVCHAPFVTIQTDCRCRACGARFELVGVYALVKWEDSRESPA